ncbi:TadE/TadG family type IV pilus assembly protein [Bradyrhizobium acaciae]|uniref:TadE/TadG family type IV pilus assembly protein n=1 Tax=Bradyrhizobium acaciae TaxID=2683706 RepID=UPI001E3AE37E|nr:TadE/TadG family type IV pilus assembly protein [Bradyrhizobium acaciae]MCC8983857.1 Tad domain-containing protein [Bradyrhizobium acaciae]
MLGSAIFDRIRTAARRFSGATGGNVAVIFTFAILPILAFMGAAVDYTRANNARTAMQSALDSTALMLSKDLTMGSITAAQIPSKAQSYFNALFTNKDGQGIAISATYTTPTASAAATILLSGSGYINTYFMKFADLSGGNFQKMNFGTSTTTTWGNVKMRVALALDNTGSMSQNGKITALRNAVAGTGGLIDQLSALSKNNGDVYISVIPFAKVVNLGASNYGQNYIDWTDWLNPPTAQPNNGSTQATLPMNWHAVGPGARCPWTNSNGGFTCTKGPSNSSSTTYIPSSGTYSGYICPSVDYNSHSLYNGCWVSTQVGTGVFCTGSSSCACPTDNTGYPVSGCSCGTKNGVYSCSGNLYTHDWTQPGPNDTVDNKNQPRVTAVVGWTNNQWTSTNKTPTVVNNWQQPSTNPISTWTGCITDRTQPNDATGVLPNTSDVTTMFPANEYYENSTAYCNSNVSTPLEPIIPLSYNWSALKTAVNAMQPTGGTDQSVGLAWAWQSLLVGGPLNTPAEDSNTTYNRVIILLSDGLNTEDRWPDYGDGSSQASGNPIDARQALQCQNLQNAKDSSGNPMYTIYTIQVNTSTPADPTSTVLKNCASSPDKFYMLTSSTQILTTFNTIGTALSKLRLAK